MTLDSSKTNLGQALSLISPWSPMPWGSWGRMSGIDWMYSGRPWDLMIQKWWPAHGHRVIIKWIYYEGMPVCDFNALDWFSLFHFIIPHASPRTILNSMDIQSPSASAISLSIDKRPDPWQEARSRVNKLWHRGGPGEITWRARANNVVPILSPVICIARSSWKTDESRPSGSIYYTWGASA